MTKRKTVRVFPPLPVLIERAKAGRKTTLFRYLAWKMPDWSRADQEAVLLLLENYLPGRAGRPRGSKTVNRKPKESDALVAIALAIRSAKKANSKIDVEKLATKHLDDAGLYDDDGEATRLTTVINHVNRKRADFDKRAASAGLLPHN